MINSSGKITPEQQQAIEVFRKSMEMKDSLTVDKVNFEHIANTGSRIFVIGKIGRKSLPNEHYWVWNQSNAQIVVEQNVDHDIIMKKLNPRKKSRTQLQAIPSYKIWVFVIKSKWSDPKENLNFIWCERGADTVSPQRLQSDQSPPPNGNQFPYTDLSANIQYEITNDQNEIETVPVLLPNLKFLSTFMDQETAMLIFGETEDANVPPTNNYTYNPPN